MNIQPLDDRVVIEPLSQEEVTKSGIVLPSTVEQEKPQEGKVVAIGPGKMGEDGKRLPMDVKVGDIVLYSKYAPTEIEIEGKEILIVGQDSVLAIVNK